MLYFASIMSDIIYWVLVVKIRPGEEESFRELSSEMIESARHEPGTLAYEWTLTHDGSTCHIYERYANSAAIQTHLERIGGVIARFFELCTPVSFHVYGSPEDDVKAGLEDLQPVYLMPLGGFSR